MKTKETKDVAFYLDLPYTVILRRDDEGDYVARVAELEGCTAHGHSEAEAVENLKEVQQAWIEDALEVGDEIPQPESEEELPSGKWVQRVPRTLHKKLVELAKKEEISLNQLVISLLAEGVGMRRAAAKPSHFVLAPLHEPAKQVGRWVSDYTYVVDDVWTIHEPPPQHSMEIDEVLKWASATPDQLTIENYEDKRCDKRKTRPSSFHLLSTQTSSGA